MTITKKIGAIALFTAMSWGVQAGNFNYNYAQVGYETGDFEGLTLTGAFEVNKELYVLARYVSVTNDEFGIDLDYDEISVGAGYHMPIDNKTDAVFTVSFSSGEVDAIILGNKVGSDDTGLLVTAGVRHNLNSKIELAGGIYHISTFNGDTGIQGEARYNIDNKMSAGVTYISGDYLDGLGINFRVNF